MNKLNCPVCNRLHIEEDVCPNCETDLSTYRILANLPVQTPADTPKKRQYIPIWLPISVAILFLLLGLGLGFATNAVIAKQHRQDIEPSSNIVSSISPNEPKQDRQTALNTQSIETAKQPKSNCGGFNYTIRQGDSLSLIASRFYGNSDFWLLISEVNPHIRGRENSIEVNELLLIPNLKSDCLDS